MSYSGSSERRSWLPVAEQTNNNQNKQPLMHRGKCLTETSGLKHMILSFQTCPSIRTTTMASWAFNKRSAGTQVTGYLPETAGKDDYQILHSKKLANRTKINPGYICTDSTAASVSADTGVPSNAVICDNPQKYSSLNYQPFSPVIFLLHRKIHSAPFQEHSLGIQIIQHPWSIWSSVWTRESPTLYSSFQHSVIQSVFFLPPETEDDKIHNSGWSLFLTSERFHFHPTCLTVIRDNRPVSSIILATESVVR